MNRMDIMFAVVLVGFGWISILLGVIIDGLKKLVEQLAKLDGRIEASPFHEGARIIDALGGSPLRRL